MQPVVSISALPLVDISLAEPGLLVMFKPEVSKTESAFNVSNMLAKKFFFSLIPYSSIGGCIVDKNLLHPYPYMPTS